MDYTIWFSNLFWSVYDYDWSSLYHSAAAPWSINCVCSTTVFNLIAQHRVTPRHFLTYSTARCCWNWSLWFRVILALKLYVYKIFSLQFNSMNVFSVRLRCIHFNVYKDKIINCKLLQLLLPVWQQIFKLFLQWKIFQKEN